MIHTEISDRMQALLSLLGSFPPSEWAEELYIKTPPFIFENSLGKSILIPTRRDSELILEKLCQPLGLKKRKQQTQIYFIISHSNSIRAFRDFDWFIRRSWEEEQFAVLWSVIYAAQAKAGINPKIPFDSIVELSSVEPKDCVEILETLLDVRNGFLEKRFAEFQVDTDKLNSALKSLTGTLPSWTEELIMEILCSGTGGSVADIYERLLNQGLTVGAAYKIIERLKRQGYVHAFRHYRVNERGPMREHLTTSCDKCFYGYSSEDRCFSDTFRKLEDVLERYYGRKLNTEESSNLYASIRAMPYSSKVTRRVLECLMLIHQVESITREKRVLSLLGKIEEDFKLNLPMKMLPDYENEKIS